jgi:hypothetical protein
MIKHPTYHGARAKHFGIYIYTNYMISLIMQCHIDHLMPMLLVTKSYR